MAKGGDRREVSLLSTAKVHGEPHKASCAVSTQLFTYKFLASPYNREMALSFLCWLSASGDPVRNKFSRTCYALLGGEVGNCAKEATLLPLKELAGKKIASLAVFFQR